MKLPAKMTAILADKPGGPEVLRAVEVAVPEPGERELLIKVEAAGVNGPDLLQRKGAYPPPPGASHILGLELAGTVVAADQACTRFKPGDRVMALVTGGAYAQYCVAHEDCTLPLPGGLSMTGAGGVPETFFTVWTNVFDRAGLQKGETFLVHGGSSGIGTTAIQMAVARGAVVYATAGSDEKCGFCQKLGATLCVNYRSGDFYSIIRQATDGRGVDVILDMVGGDYFDRNLKLAARDGRIVQIAFLKGSKVTADLMPVMLKRLTVTGSTLRVRPIREKAAIARALEKNIWPLIEREKIRPQVFKTFALEQAGQAHALMETSGHMGKVILLP